MVEQDLEQRTGDAGGLVHQDQICRGTSLYQVVGRQELEGRRAEVQSTGRGLGLRQQARCVREDRRDRGMAGGRHQDMGIVLRQELSSGEPKGRGLAAASVRCEDQRAAATAPGRLEDGGYGKTLVWGARIEGRGAGAARAAGAGWGDGWPARNRTAPGARVRTPAKRLSVRLGQSLQLRRRIRSQHHRHTGLAAGPGIEVGGQQDQQSAAAQGASAAPRLSWSNSLWAS